VRSTPRPNGSPRRPAATTLTSSPTPSEPPTGGATTTSRSRYSPNARREAPDPGLDRGRGGHRGTSATIGRYIRHRRRATRLCVVDPENSAFYPAYAESRSDIVITASSRIEGIGRPRVEPSFLPDVVDRMVSVPDAASIAAALHVSAVLGRRVGASTGTNLWGAFGLLAEMVAEGRTGSVVTLLADSGDRYADTYFCDEWVKAHGLDTAAPTAALTEFERSGRWD